MILTDTYCRLAEALGRGELNDWEAQFTRGFLATCRRTGGASEKQMAVAQKLARQIEDGPAIDRGDDG